MNASVGTIDLCGEWELTDETGEHRVPMALSDNGITALKRAAIRPDPSVARNETGDGAFVIRVHERDVCCGANWISLRFGDAGHDDRSRNTHFRSIWHEKRVLVHYRDGGHCFCSEIGSTPTRRWTRSAPCVTCGPEHRLAGAGSAPEEPGRQGPDCGDDIPLLAIEAGGRLSDNWPALLPAPRTVHLATDAVEVRALTIGDFHSATYN